MQFFCFWLSIAIYQTKFNIWLVINLPQSKQPHHHRVAAGYGFVVLKAGGDLVMGGRSAIVESFPILAVSCYSINFAMTKTF